MDFKELWDLDSAMQVLTNNEAEAKLWAQAVEWLLLYEPPEIRDILLAASSAATSSAFPQLKPSHYSPDGRPFYHVRDLASNLHMSEEEARKLLAKKFPAEQREIFEDENNSGTVH
jgi:hypothetical protein